MHLLHLNTYLCRIAKRAFVSARGTSSTGKGAIVIYAFALLSISALGQGADHQASLGQGIASSSAGDQARDAQPQFSGIVLATGNQELSTALNQGIFYLLLGHNEAAKIILLEAYNQSPTSPIICSTLLLSCQGADLSSTQELSYRKAEAFLKDLDARACNFTPQEERYFNGFCFLLANDTEGAAAYFTQQAVQYRADKGLALWAILLLHSIYDAEGNASPAQAQALQLAEQALQQPQPLSLTYYLRALLEENAPSVSERALECAEKALEALPTEAMPRLLLAHLRHRKASTAAQLEPCLELLEQAEAAASSWQSKHHLHWRENSPWIRARLYRLTILQELMREKEFLELYSQTLKTNLPLSKQAIAEQNKNLSFAELLFYWELKTLPLRGNLFSPKLLSQQLLNSLIDPSRLLSCSNPQLSTLPRYAKLLALLINAQRDLQQGQVLKAQLKLKQAEQWRAELWKDWQKINSYSLITCCLRAIEACDLAINVIRLGAYQNTQIIWQTKFLDLTRPSSLLLPNILPINSIYKNKVMNAPSK